MGGRHSPPLPLGIVLGALPLRVLIYERLRSLRSLRNNKHTNVIICKKSIKNKTQKRHFEGRWL